MSDLSLLQPTEKHRVMDVVRDAGIDVSDWGNYAGGRVKAAANPRYCYEWAFVNPGKVAVLNIWYSGIREHRGVLTLEDNLRSSAAQHARNTHGASPVWKKRANAFDEAVRVAAQQLLPVRAVVCDGDRRRRAENRASRVRKRMLDPVPWAVTAYDPATGDFTLTRGALPNRLVDQFSVGILGHSATELRSVTGTEYVRDWRVRVAVLKRAGGKCEWCSSPGFATPSGDVFLETHHIIPLSENGPDKVENVAGLCPNHHREAHYGAQKEVMRERLGRMARHKRTRVGTQKQAV